MYSTCYRVCTCNRGCTVPVVECVPVVEGVLYSTCYRVCTCSRGCTVPVIEGVPVVEGVWPHGYPAERGGDRGVVHEELVRHHLKLLVATHSQVRGSNPCKIEEIAYD